jgi:hypothetical protein
MAASPPPASVLAAAKQSSPAGPFVAGASISTFMKDYTDASQDDYNQKYAALMGVFASVPGGPTPQ